MSQCISQFRPELWEASIQKGILKDKYQVVTFFFFFKVLVVGKKA